MQRSMTGKHKLIASRKAEWVRTTSGSSLTVLSLLFGRGTVIYRIYPAVFIYTLFAAAVVAVNTYTKIHLGIGSVLLTVISMVLGFVVALRVTTGYDRYWLGRIGWSDVTRNTRTFARLVWYHCPARLTPSRDHVPVEDIERAIEEKKVVLDLVEAFAIALKHHLREEPGPYYEDLYPLLVSLETSPYHQHRLPISPTIGSPAAAISGLPGGSDAHPYGTFESPNGVDAHTPLLPSSNAPPTRSRMSVYFDLVPFASFFVTLGHIFHRKGTITTGTKFPRVAGGGGNIPLEVLRCLSEWCAVLEERGSVPGTTVGSLMGTLTAMEDSLTALERILTTPLPFVYTAHIRQTIWIFLFTMPFQLCDTFGWVTIPGVAVAAFLYLGFVAAGEELEAPFGYDRNDLDLDFICQELIHNDLEEIRKSNVPNSYLSMPGSVDAKSVYGRGAVVDAGYRYKVGREATSLIDSSRGEGSNTKGYSVKKEDTHGKGSSSRGY